MATPNARKWKIRKFLNARGGPIPCHYCGKPLTLDGKDTTVDHYVPLSRNGRDAPVNFVMSCQPCNLTKGSDIPGDAKEDQFYPQGEGRLARRKRKAHRALDRLTRLHNLPLYTNIPTRPTEKPHIYLRYGKWRYCQANVMMGEYNALAYQWILRKNEEIQYDK